MTEKTSVPFATHQQRLSREQIEQRRGLLIEVLKRDGHQPDSVGIIDTNILCDMALSALSETPAKTGMVLVPREPTEAMHAAAAREWDGRMSARSAGVWQAMLDAAPQAPRTERVPPGDPLTRPGDSRREDRSAPPLEESPRTETGAKREQEPCAWRWRNGNHSIPQAWSYSEGPPVGPGAGDCEVEPLYPYPWDYTVPSAIEAKSPSPSFVNMRIAYKGFSYGMGSEWGIESLRKAIEERGDH